MKVRGNTPTFVLLIHHFVNKSFNEDNLYVYVSDGVKQTSFSDNSTIVLSVIIMKLNFNISNLRIFLLHNYTQYI